MEKDYEVINVHVSFKKRLDEFMKEFEKKNGIKLSYSQATKIIDAKIEKIGGIKV